MGGVWGVTASVSPAFVPSYIEKLSSVLSAPVTADELKKAKVALKKAASMSVDKAGDCADDIAKQMFMGGGKVMGPEELGAIIDGVNEASIAKVQALVKSSK